jgi:hypothetical protein
MGIKGLTRLVYSVVNKLQGFLLIYFSNQPTQITMIDFIYQNLGKAPVVGRLITIAYISAKVKDLVSGKSNTLDPSGQPLRLPDLFYFNNFRVNIFPSIITFNKYIPSFKLLVSKRSPFTWLDIIRFS